jgi:hypothetical protein
LEIEEQSGTKLRLLYPTKPANDVRGFTAFAAGRLRESSSWAVE